jgi:hypothetical protein
MRAAATHEDLRRQTAVRGSSDRSFGLVLAAFFSVLGLWPLVHKGAARPWSIAVAAVFAILALWRPGLLHPLNTLWTRLGLLLGRVVNPVVMAILFYFVIAPTGLILRWRGKDPLRLRYDSGATSYWIPRQPPGPAPETMANQF